MILLGIISIWLICGAISYVVWRNWFIKDGLSWTLEDRYFEIFYSIVLGPIALLGTVLTKGFMKEGNRKQAKW